MLLHVRVGQQKNNLDTEIMEMAARRHALLALERTGKQGIYLDGPYHVQKQPCSRSAFREPIGRLEAKPEVSEGNSTKWGYFSPNLSCNSDFL